MHEKVEENWIGEQCSETEENLRKNNSKRAYQLVKDVTTVNKDKLLLSKIVQKKKKKNASQRNETDGQNTAMSCTITKPFEIHQYWTVPRQTQMMTTHPSQKSGG